MKKYLQAKFLKRKGVELTFFGIEYLSVHIGVEIRFNAVVVVVAVAVATIDPLMTA